MMKIKTLLIAIFLFSKYSYCQEPVIDRDISRITPASPTVASFMKFEEIPVNNYTGIPDISIPLFTVESRSKNLSVDISMRYHPTSIAADEKAGYTGLGWNLDCGGIVSRTVRGLPDEIFILDGSQSNGKVGIYQKGVYNHTNWYDEIVDVNGNFSSSPNLDQFLYDAYQAGKYDTEYDLYQFNFMGYQGRFILVRNQSGALEIVRLDSDKSTKVEIDYSLSANVYTFNGFTIYDEKGLKYMFNAKEVTTQYDMTQSRYYPLSVVDNISNGIIYPSAFHLTHVYDNNNQLLLQNQYVDVNEVFSNVTRKENYLKASNWSTVWHNFISCGYNPEENMSRLEPMSVTSVSNLSVKTKKISSVIIEGKGGVYFETGYGREDSNISNSTTSPYLSSILIKNVNQDQIKKIELDYTYSSVPLFGITQKRMLLKSIKEYGSNNSEFLNFEFYYRNNSTNGGIVKKDYWGYFNLDNQSSTDYFFRETNKEYCTTNVLERIVYPTGKCTYFNFESNTYSYIGDRKLSEDELLENPDNFFETEEEIVLTSSGTQFCHNITFNSLNDYLPYAFEIITSKNDSLQNNVLNVRENDLVISGNLICNQDNGCRTSFSIDGQSNYTLCFGHFNIGETQNITVRIIKKYKRTNLYQFLYGGGVRIKEILSFDSYNESIMLDGIYSAKKKFKYDFFDKNFSSGSLAFAKPNFKYSISKKARIHCTGLNGAYIYDDVLEYDYDVKTSYNNLLSLRTHGADVGYKNVTISEENNGRIEFTYSSPIDYPEPSESYTIDYPFFPPKNIDYKRGLLLDKSYFDNNGKILLKESNDYVFTNEKEIAVGLKLSTNGSCPYNYLYRNYNEYNAVMVNCYRGHAVSCEITCHWPYLFIHYGLIRYACGHSQLDFKKTQNFFYDGNQVNIVEKSERFHYNQSNNKISSHITINSPTESLNTDYLYHTGNSVHSQNRISEIEEIRNYRNGQLVASKKIDYANSWNMNSSYLPYIVKESKGQSTLESRLKYNQYDEFSNPLEIEQLGGVKTVYIWGYNKTLPVAKLENIAYASIPPSHLQAIETASNSNNEANLKAALTDLRNDSALSNAMITTYTYKPLIGVSSITDPKGNIVTYHYDGFGRLEFVKDKDGNILNENKYHYRTQN